MRVTFQAIDDGLAAVNTAASQFLRAQTQVATGLRIQRPSDDPAATRRVIEGTTEIGTLDGYTRAADTAVSRLAVMDTVLGGIVDRLTEAKASAAQARGTTADAATRLAIGDKLRGLRDGLVSDLNSSYRGTYLFGGAEALVPPYAQVSGAWVYQGDATEVTVEVARNRSVATAVNGEALAKGGDANDVLTELDALIVAVEAGDEAGVAAGMTALSRAFDRAVRAQSRVGVDQQGIESEQTYLTALKLAAKTRVSRDRDADLALAISDMTQADTAYRAALQAVGASSNVSLIDYLR